AGGEVLLVREQVTGKVLDFGSQNGDLDLRRTGVLIVRLELLNDLLLLLLVEHRGTGGRVMASNRLYAGVQRNLSDTQEPNDRMNYPLNVAKAPKIGNS